LYNLLVLLVDRGHTHRTLILNLWDGFLNRDESRASCELTMPAEEPPHMIGAPIEFTLIGLVHFIKLSSSAKLRWSKSTPLLFAEAKNKGKQAIS
jgi:hypothetical protein